MAATSSSPVITATSGRRCCGAGFPSCRTAGAAAAMQLPAQQWDRLFALMPRGWGPPQAGDKIRKVAEILTCERPDDIYRRLVSQWQNPAALALGGREVEGILRDPVVA